MANIKHLSSLLVLEITLLITLLNSDWAINFSLLLLAVKYSSSALTSVLPLLLFRSLNLLPRLWINFQYLWLFLAELVILTISSKPLSSLLSNSLFSFFLIDLFLRLTRLLFVNKLLYRSFSYAYTLSFVTSQYFIPRFLISRFFFF